LNFRERPVVMPIYEYRCAGCGHTLDALQKMADEPLKDCPECEQPSLKRLMSAPSFRLKGGGWYETDFKSDKEKKRNLADVGHNGGDKAGDKAGGKGGDKAAAEKPSAGGEKSATASAGDKKSDKKDQTKTKGSGSTSAT